jgi:hypothetical protein
VSTAASWKVRPNSTARVVEFAAKRGEAVVAMTDTKHRILKIASRCQRGQFCLLLAVLDFRVFFDCAHQWIVGIICGLRDKYPRPVFGSLQVAGCLKEFGASLLGFVDVDSAWDVASLRWLEDPQSHRACSTLIESRGRNSICGRLQRRRCATEKFLPRRS